MIRTIAPFVAIVAWMVIAFHAVTTGAVERERKQPLEDLESLTVEPEGQRCEGKPYEHYQDAYREYESDIGEYGLEERIVRYQRGIYSPYDGETYDSIKQTDIEHITARHQAHVSGLCEAPKTAKVAYTKDLRNLTLATPEVNRSQKSDKDFGHWKPDRNDCWMAARIVATKRVWALTVDQRERDELESTIKDCTSFEMQRRPPPG